MKAELDIKPFLKAINEFATAEEQQPCGVQVVEWVGLTDHLETEWLLRPAASILTKKQRR